MALKKKKKAVPKVASTFHLEGSFCAPSRHAPSRLSRDPAHFSAVLVVAISSWCGIGDGLITPLINLFSSRSSQLCTSVPPPNLACHRLLVFIRLFLVLEVGIEPTALYKPDKCPTPNNTCRPFTGRVQLWWSE